MAALDKVFGHGNFFSKRKKFSVPSFIRLSWVYFCYSWQTR